MSKKIYICNYSNSKHCKEIHNNAFWFKCPCRIPHKATKDCLTENFCNGVYEKIKVKCIEYEKGGNIMRW